MGPPSSLLLLVLIMFLMTCLGDYKEKRNPFVPAEPGSTPACAKLGTSFCEYVDDYPEHVIGYLLERGAFDYGTLFTSDQNVKPPLFNKTETSNEKLSSRHRQIQYNFSPPFAPKPVNELLSHFTRVPVPFSNQLYSDYNNFNGHHHHSTLIPYGPSTPAPVYGHSTPVYGTPTPVYGTPAPIYGHSTPRYHSRPGYGREAEPLFFSDLSNVHFTTLKHGDQTPRTKQPEVHVKHQGSEHHGQHHAKTKTTSGPTPYKYKIIKNTDDEDQEQSAESYPESRELPSPNYLPPPPPSKPEASYLPPSPELTLPSKSYLPPASPSYVPPSPDLSLPIKSYLPPPPPPSPSYLPPSPKLSVPHKSYLPPPPPASESSIVHHSKHNPTIANLNEIHTLPTLDKLHGGLKPKVIFPQAAEDEVQPQPIFEPVQYEPKTFIGPQLPPKRSQYSGSHPNNNIEFSNKDKLTEALKEFKESNSNKDKLTEALKKFNAKPNIDRENGLDQVLTSNDDIELVSVHNELDILDKLSIPDSQEKLSDLKITTSGPLEQVTSVKSPGTTRFSTNRPRLSSTTTFTSISSTSTVSTSSVSIPKLKTDDFLPHVVDNVMDLEGPPSIGRTNDNFIFGPQTRPTTPGPAVNTNTRSSLVFSSVQPDLSIDQAVNDIVLGDIEILITGRGDKTVKPRSFTPDSLDVEGVNSISSTIAPNTINDNKVTGNNLNVGNVIIVNDHNREELLFQPKPFKADNYKVTDFSHQTSAQGHSYRLTTPTSSVFVQRSFGNVPSAPVSERTLKRQINSSEILENGINTALGNNNTTTEDVFNSLQGAVDVLTRSSQGYMDVPEEIGNNLEDIQLESDIQSLQKEIETLQKDIATLNKAEITFDLTRDENIEEVISLQQNLDHLVQGMHTENSVQQDIKQPQFQHFPVVNVQNIYDKDTIETLLVDFTDNDNTINTENIENAVIERKQLDDILLANYLKSTHDAEMPNSVTFDMTKKIINHSKIPKASVEVVHGKPIDKVEGPRVSNFPRAEKLISIPDTVSNIMTSVNSYINYDDKVQQSSSSSSSLHSLRASSLHPPRRSYSNNHHLPHPSTTEKLNPNDVAIKSHNKLNKGQTNFVNIIKSPHLVTQNSAQPNIEPEETFEYVPEAAKDNVELLDSYDSEDIQKFWPEHRINATYQENWIGHDESPIEVERRRRQLGDVKITPNIQSTLEQQHHPSGHITSSTLEQHNRHPQRKRRQTDEDDQSMDPKVPPTEMTPDQERGRRQTSDPDNLCPTAARFITPRAAMSVSGTWMFTVNMPGEAPIPATQLIRTEECISDNCRGLCQLPPGLSSKCNQQYSQRKLVALHPDGNRLIVDMFWFPSCCVCQISQE